MDKTESQTGAAVQGSASNKPSAHFLKAALGNTHTMQGILDRHCPDELAFWMSGGYSVDKHNGTSAPKLALAT